MEVRDFRFDVLASEIDEHEDLRWSIENLARLN